MQPLHSFPFVRRLGSFHPADLVRLASASFALALSSALWSALPSPAAQLVEIDRRVVTSSFVDAYQAISQDDAVGYRSTEPGTFLEAAVGGARVGDITNAFGEAFQETDVRFGPGSGLRISGSGGSGFGIDVEDRGFPSRAQGTADTTLTILFEVTSPLPYSFGLALSADLVQLEILTGQGTASSMVVAFVRFFGASSGVLLDLGIEDTTPDGNAVEERRVLSGVLAPDVYSLELGATSGLRGFENVVGLAQSGFGIDFLAVPEPGSVLLLSLGLAALARPPRHRRARRAQGSQPNRA